jgi:hypothetical protein
MLAVGWVGLKARGTPESALSISNGASLESALSGHLDTRHTQEQVESIHEMVLHASVVDSKLASVQPWC